MGGCGLRVAGGCGHRFAGGCGHPPPLIPPRHMKDEQSKEIEDSVLDRCIPHGGVVHIYVDRRSPFVSPC